MCSTNNSENRENQWSSLVEQIDASQERLQQYLDAEDWEAATQEVNTRGHLLKELANCLENLPFKMKNQDRPHVKIVLKKIQSFDLEFMKKLGGRLTTINIEINNVKKGCKALRLYKPLKAGRARFFNSLG